MPLKLERNDITRMRCDAIVNATNTKLLMGDGVSGMISRAAGEKALQDACMKLAPCPVGNSVITPGFNLKAKFIIHTVGPTWRDGTRGEETLLRSCYRTSLDLARSRGLHSIAFPLISSGHFGYPKAQALQVAVSEIQKWLLQDPSEDDMEVTLLLFDRGSYHAGIEQYDDIVSYLEDNSPDVVAFERRQLMRRQVQEYADRDEFPDRGLPHGIHADFGLPRNLQPDDWKQVIAAKGESFCEALFRLIDRSGQKDSEIYKRANIDRRHFAKLKNPNYNPGKPTVLCLCLALHLNEDETADLLSKAGYAFSDSDIRDLIIRYCIRHEYFDVLQINIILFEQNQPPLSA